MNRESFGGRKPYFADFEISDELSPDPFSEEPNPHTHPHMDRFHPSERSKKVKKSINQEESGDIQM